MTIILSVMSISLSLLLSLPFILLSSISDFLYLLVNLFTEAVCNKLNLLQKLTQADHIKIYIRINVGTY